jgi:hypothetical protein
VNAITTRALEHCRAGMSPSEATVIAIMGRSISPTAIARVELIVSADLRRRQREAAERRGAVVA